MSRLILYRHAKSSWEKLEQEDHERPLNERGSKAAPKMAKWLASNGFKPDLVLCSNAVRTRATLALTLPAFDAPLPDIVIDDALYLASAEVILERVRVHAGRAPTVMVVGHNPGLQALSLSLVGDGPSEALRAMSLKFPTAAVAVFDLGVLAFSDALAGRCKLIAFQVPRELD
ncbi:MAG: histidine phosphatase family protein [Pseudomonadota bacterium]